MFRFDLVDLGLFRHVVEAGSITHGAQRAHLALAAASARIRAMEDSLGTTLLTRGRQGVSPTAAGRALLGHARAILAGTERLREEMAAYSGGAAGQIRVVANTHALIEFLPAPLADFLASHPGIAVEIEERTSDEIVGLVAEGAADFGLLSGTVDTGGLATFPFREDRFVLVAARGDPLAARAEVALADVLERDLVGLDRRSAISRFLVEKAARAGRPMRLRGAIARLRCRVPAGGGAGRPRDPAESTALRAARSLALGGGALSDPWARRDLTLCLRDRDALPPFVRDLIDTLRA